MNNPIERKIESFADLPSGWNYGEGDPINHNVIDKALEIYQIGKPLYLNCEVIPNTDGSIEISLYRQDHFMDFCINEDMSIDFVYEVGNGTEYNEIENINDISIDAIKNKLNRLIEA